MQYCLKLFAGMQKNPPCTEHTSRLPGQQRALLWMCCTVSCCFADV